MIHESGDDYQQPDETVLFSCDKAMRDLHERTFFESGITPAVNVFVDTYQPQSYDSFIPVAKMLGSLADFMYEPGDDSLVLRTVLLQGVKTGLCVANETYDGVVDVDDTLQSIADLCIPDEHGRTNINQIVQGVQNDIANMPEAARLILADWCKDYGVPVGQEMVFNTAFSIVLAGAREKVLQRQVEQAARKFDWDGLLGGDE
jgi:hypothetical protein